MWSWWTIGCSYHTNNSHTRWKHYKNTWSTRSYNKSRHISKNCLFTTVWLVFEHINLVSTDNMDGFWLFWQIIISFSYFSNYRLVDKVNKSIGQDPNSKTLIGVLDIYGFESFKFNRCYRAPCLCVCYDTWSWFFKTFSISKAWGIIISANGCLDVDVSKMLGSL